MRSDGMGTLLCRMFFVISSKAANTFSTETYWMQAMAGQPVDR
jgi:hypothetical protein